MKFKLYKELLSENEMLSHVFLNSCPMHISEKIAEGTKKMYDVDKLSNSEIQEQRVVDMKLFIEGEEANLRNFFNELAHQFTSIVKKEATKMVKEQTSNKIDELIYKLNNISEITDNISEDINWNYDKNPFQK